MGVALLALSALLALAWLPILLNFFRNWRGRSNPISLAIVFIVFFAIYISIVPFVGAEQDPVVMMCVVQGVNAVTCLFFHISFRWARKRWSPKDKDAPPDEQPKRRVRGTDYPTNVTK